VVVAATIVVPPWMARRRGRSNGRFRVLPPRRLRRTKLWRTDGDGRQEQLRECEESIASSGWQARGNRHGECVCACRSFKITRIFFESFCPTGLQFKGDLPQNQPQTNRNGSLNAPRSCSGHHDPSIKRGYPSLCPSGLQSKRISLASARLGFNLRGSPSKSNPDPHGKGSFRTLQPHGRRRSGHYDPSPKRTPLKLCPSGLQSKRIPLEFCPSGLQLKEDLPRLSAC
jgi:hypothetical protein